MEVITRDRGQYTNIYSATEGKDHIYIYIYIYIYISSEGRRAYT